MWLKVNILDCLQLVMSTLGGEKEELLCLCSHFESQEKDFEEQILLKGSYLQIVDPDSVKLGFCWVREEEESWLYVWTVNKIQLSKEFPV